MTEKIQPPGLSFDNVRIQPQFSDIESRYGDQISTRTRIAKNLPEIEIPVISANMDTVTEAEMAITMALNGGLGIIHRFMTTEQQAAEVRKVKERMRVIEQDPPLLSEQATIANALDLLQYRKRGYVLVFGENNQNNIIGIATTRDFNADSPDTPITQVMTPREKLIYGTPDFDISQAVSLMKKFRIQKLPIFFEDGSLKGVYTIKDYEYFKKHPFASLDAQGRLIIGAAIGVQPHDIDRALALIEAGVDTLVIDIAHGHHTYVKNMLNQLLVKEQVKTPIIAGNIATRDGALFLIDNGASAVKVGIGPGFVCKTREVAGTGVPQVTAVLNVANVIESQSEFIGLISDGGIRYPGDVAIAIGAGADAVMIGSLLAGTDQSPGEAAVVDGSLKKMVRGMASASAFDKRSKLGQSTTKAAQYVPEGRTTFTPYKGSAVKVLNDLVGGLRSGMSYSGAHDIKEMQEKTIFIQFPPGSRDETRNLG